jgi:SAM-dependent methyltransferase
MAQAIHQSTNVAALQHSAGERHDSPLVLPDFQILLRLPSRLFVSGRAAMTASSLDEVRNRFSHAGAAGRWNAMYATDTERLEDANFRERRDVAVALVLDLVARAGDGKNGLNNGCDAQVLDLGCGTAPVLGELRRHGLDVVGMDYSEDMLEHARARLRAMGLDDAGLIQGDCRATTYPSGHFDIVVCLGVISYLENYDPVIAEIDRLLKPGGTVLISFRNVFNPLLSDPLALARRALRLLLTPLLGRRREPPFEIGRFLDHRQVTRKIEALGYLRQAFFGIGFGPFRLAGRALFSEKQSIRFSRRLAKFFSRLPFSFPQRWLADVSLWVYRKPAGTRCSSVHVVSAGRGQ